MIAFGLPLQLKIRWSLVVPNDFTQTWEDPEVPIRWDFMDEHPEEEKKSKKSKKDKVKAATGDATGRKRIGSWRILSPKAK